MAGQGSTTVPDLFETYLRDLRTLDLSLDAILKEYDSKTARNTDSLHLGQHPIELNATIDAYKAHVDRRKANFIRQECKEKFLQATLSSDQLQVPDKEQLQEKKSAGQIVESELNLLEIDNENLKDAISRSHVIPERYQTLMKKADKAVELLNQIRRDERELDRINELVRDDEPASLEEWEAENERLMEEDAEVNMEIDDTKESTANLSKELARLKRDLAIREEERRLAESKAKGALEKSSSMKEAMEKMLARYNSMKEDYENLLGVESLEMPTPTLIRVRFATPKHEELEIHLDESTKQVYEATLSNSDIDIEDLVVLSEKWPAVEAPQIIFQGVLSRIKA
ncbi:hypothetical protein BCR43DRAFT_484512 [Syncephalastrum racemosum]|uniref:Uncharacterized protein n=1 Tax=Syncephalastrum racemosum TaxID=13706 RepID=A0A1X2HKU5_SYNRA|nr:hypothetical protein BCR43DRAFT_484512 [Syncephalastrum racemosum]